MLNAYQRPVLAVVWNLLTFAAFAQQPTTLPEKVTILVDAVLPVPAAVVETNQPVAAGTKVFVRSASGDSVKVAYGIGEGVVKKSDTDFAERAQEAAQKAKENADRLKAQANESRLPMTYELQAAPLSKASSREAECREIAQREYPGDARMEEYIYKQQLAASRYMETVNDPDVKTIALREYPGDFSMQKYVYDQQSSAKRYMASAATESEVKQIALREYPNDYSMQKYVYDQQLSAKKYLQTVTDSGHKQRAAREYPNDYSLQKYVYDQLSSGR